MLNVVSFWVASLLLLLLRLGKLYRLRCHLLMEQCCDDILFVCPVNSACDDYPKRRYCCLKRIYQDEEVCPWLDNFDQSYPLSALFTQGSISIWSKYRSKRLPISQGNQIRGVPSTHHIKSHHLCDLSHSLRSLLHGHAYAHVYQYQETHATPKHPEIILPTCKYNGNPVQISADIIVTASPITHLKKSASTTVT